MERRIDKYLKTLVNEDRFDFYSHLVEFSDKEIAPKLLDWERNHELVSDDCIRQMGDLGLFGLPIPEEYGGQGGDHLDLLLMGMALGYHSQSVAITPGAAISLGAKPILLFGNDAPCAVSHAAAWMQPGVNQLTMSFDAEELAGCSAPLGPSSSGSVSGSSRRDLR